jgi:hypothetical protein
MSHVLSQPPVPCELLDRVCERRCIVLRGQQARLLLLYHFRKRPAAASDNGNPAGPPPAPARTPRPPRPRGRYPRLAAAPSARQHSRAVGPNEKLFCPSGPRPRIWCKTLGVHAQMSHRDLRFLDPAFTNCSLTNAELAITLRSRSRARFHDRARNSPLFLNLVHSK